IGQTNVTSCLLCDDETGERTSTPPCPIPAQWHAERLTQTETMNSKTILGAADFGAARKRLLQMHLESGVGHIGGNLSALDALLVVFHEYLRDHDHFVLSKGHSVGALYVTLWSLGRLQDADLKLFHKDDTLLSGHPPA